MLALLARLALALELTAYVGVGWLLHRQAGWHPVALVMAAVACALGVRLLLVCFTCAMGGWVHRSPRCVAHELGAAGTLAYVLGEYRALLEDNLVNLPWERLVVRADPPARPSSRLPVILVHGYFSNRGFFRQLVPALEAEGIAPLFAPNFNVIFEDIEHFATELHQEIERIATATGQPRVILACHSMGGLAARRYVMEHGAARIERLVTIATPHHGTAMAALGLGANARQMYQHSAFLQALEASEGATPPSFPAISIYSPHDNLVAPQETSRLPWARNIALPGLGHVAILRSWALIVALRDELR